MDVAAEDQAVFYLLRLAAFLLIIWAVVDKNLVDRGGRSSAKADRGKVVGASG